MITNENLIEYARVIGFEINEDDNFENIYKKVTGKEIIFVVICC